VDEHFDAFWVSGPWVRVGKKAAVRHFHATVKTEEDWVAIQSAREHYERHLLLNAWLRPQHGSTWFNNWLDWVEFQEPVAIRGPQVGTADYYSGLKVFE
jgi:hypothetical protein